MTRLMNEREVMKYIRTLPDDSKFKAVREHFNGHVYESFSLNGVKIFEIDWFGKDTKVYRFAA